MSVNLFLNRVFADAIQFRISAWDYSGFILGSKSNNQCRYWRKERGIWPRRPRGECHMKMESEIAVMPLQAKECQGFSPSVKARREAKQHILPHAYLLLLLKPDVWDWEELLPPDPGPTASFRPWRWQGPGLLCWPTGSQLTHWSWLFFSFSLQAQFLLREVYTFLV